MRHVLALALMPALATTIPSVAFPQEGRGSLEGRITDTVGRSLMSAEVTVERPDGSTAARATTDEHGAWRIVHVAPGEYWVVVRRPGYRAHRQRLVVAPASAAQLTVALELVRFSLDELVVSGVAPVIPTTHAELGTRLTTAEIALLPSTLELRQLIALTPGARPDQIWGGASDQANAYTLDGTMVNHVGRGGAVFLPSPSWIETLDVRGLGAGADVASAQGGLVEVTTLEGRNVFEGALRSSFESHRLNGSNLIPDEVGEELSHRWDLDGHIRGPLVRDRLHFAVFGQVIRQADLVPDQLSPASESFVPDLPTLRDHRWLAKLTWKPNDKDLVQTSVMGRVQRGDHREQTGYETPEATSRLFQSNMTGNVTWQRSWSPRSALTVRLGGYAARERLEPYAGPAVPGIELFTPENPPRYQNAPFRTRAAPSSLGVTAVWTARGRLAGAEHELRLGAEYAIGAFDFERLRNGGVTWRPLRAQGLDPADPATWVYGNAIATSWGGETRLDSDVRNAAVFIQDHVGVLSWLRFTPGVRLGAWTGGLTPATGSRFTAVQDQSVAPRIGVVADLDGSGGFVAKAHWGRYHQPMFAALFERIDGASTYNDREIWSYLGAPPTDPRQTFTATQRDSLAALGLFRLEETDRLDQAGRVEGYRQPFVEQQVLSLEKAFGGGWKAGLVYVYRENRDMVALVDRNLLANYTVVENVIVRDRFRRPLYFGGEPLVLDIAISNEDILLVQDLLRRQVITAAAPGQLYVPPGLSAAELAALRYEPDFVLTNVSEATRRFRQFQFRLEARYRTWWASGSATLSTLNGNINVVTGPDDYTTGGPGPWVRLNEQFNFFGALSNQSRFEGKAHVGGLLSWRVRGGAFFSFATGDRVTPTMLISSLLSDYAVAVRRQSDTTRVDTLSLNRFLFQSTSGHRIFIQPRGTYRFQSRVSLDLHLERSFPRDGSEILIAVDAFNVLGDRSVTGIQTVVNTARGFFDSDYGRVRARVPPRALRLGAGVRF